MRSPSVAKTGTFEAASTTSTSPSATTTTTDSASPANLEAQFAQFTTAANGAVDTLAIHLDATAPATVFTRHHRVNPAVAASVPATFTLDTGGDFTIRPTSGEAVLARLPMTDQLPSEFVADGPLSYTPTNADPTQFGITFIPSEQGAIEAAHIRISGTIYPAQRNPPSISAVTRGDSRCARSGGPLLTGDC